MPPTALTRRLLLTRLLHGGTATCARCVFPAALLADPAWAQPAAGADAGVPAPTPAERGAMADLARGFMRQYDVPALSVAIGHAGALIYEDAFGFADREARAAAEPGNLYRIASISKTITSATIFALIEQNKLRLDARIFGLGAVLGTDYGRPPYNPGVAEITLEHLLTHTGGGWNNQHADPMFMNPGMNHAQLIEWVLRTRPLDHPPGQSYAYSNFGYCVLGRVIEKITRTPYAVHAADAVLKRCGITDMAIGGNTLAARRRGEVRYYGQGDNPYGMNVARMDSHGGWIARPADLVQFFMHVDGFKTPPNILAADTIKQMTTASTANPGYAKGWEVNKYDNWWHNGSLPGTSTIAVRTHSGFCWAAFTNTRRSKSALDSDLDRLVWKMAGAVKGWRV
jgi:CubicO group peptidase (beta-lactamase class C family)